VAVGADDVHFDFAGGVAAEDGTILNEDDAGAIAGGGERGADAGETAAGDEEITIKFVDYHGGKFGLWFGSGLRPGQFKGAGGETLFIAEIGTARVL
jgi:hypothetical protein